MKPTQPTRVANTETYWTEAPPEESPRCRMWRERIVAGWRPNSRIRTMGYYDSAAYYGVYIWEYLNIISPMLRGLT